MIGTKRESNHFEEDDGEDEHRNFIKQKLSAKGAKDKMDMSHEKTGFDEMINNMPPTIEEEKQNHRLSISRRGTYQI